MTGEEDGVKERTYEDRMWEKNETVEEDGVGNKDGRNILTGKRRVRDQEQNWTCEKNS